MSPSEFRSRLRGKFIDLDIARRPRNLDDLVEIVTGSRTRKALRTQDKKSGQTRDLRFPNGSFQHMEVVFKEGARAGWSVHKFSFHFVPGAAGNPWFRYDRDPQAARGLEHPLVHLHVGADDPRYPIGELDTEDLLALVDFLAEQRLV